MHLIASNGADVHERQKGLSSQRLLSGNRFGGIPEEDIDKMLDFFEISTCGILG
jgi:hypothetical protein